MILTINATRLNKEVGQVNGVDHLISAFDPSHQWLGDGMFFLRNNQESDNSSLAQSFTTGNLMDSFLFPTVNSRIAELLINMNQKKKEME